MPATCGTTTTADTVGSSGRRRPGNAAFGLTASGTDLRLSAGTYYVEGVLCEVESEVSVWQQPSCRLAAHRAARRRQRWPPAPRSPPAVYLA